MSVPSAVPQGRRVVTRAPAPSWALREQARPVPRPLSPAEGDTALQLGSQRGSHDSAVRRPHRGSLSGTGRGSRDLPPVDAPSASLGARPLLAWAWAPGFKGHRCMGAGHAPWTLCALVGRCGWALIHSSQRGASREGSGCGDPRAFPPSSQPVTWVQQVTRERVWVWLVQAPIHRPPGGCLPTSQSLPVSIFGQKLKMELRLCFAGS